MTMVEEETAFEARSATNTRECFLLPGGRRERLHVMYPEDLTGVMRAKRVCARCPEREACLNWAVEHNEREGVWGGTSERERVRLIIAYTKDGGRLKHGLGFF